MRIQARCSSGVASDRRRTSLHSGAKVGPGRSQLLIQAFQASVVLSCSKPGSSAQRTGTQRLCPRTTGGGSGADAFTPRRLLAHATSFFDPPQIATGPGEGEVWIAYADRVDPQNPRVKLLHRPAGAAEFEAPREVDPGPAAQSCAAIAVSPEGAIHLAWVDARDGGARVVYGRWSAQAQALEERVAVTSEVGGWARPALALNARGKPYLLMDRHAGTGAGEVWFAASAAPAAAAGWRYYK